MDVGVVVERKGPFLKSTLTQTHFILHDSCSSNSQAIPYKLV